MSAQAWQFYDEFKKTLGKKTIDLSADTFKIALFLSTSNCANAALVTAQLATLTNQLANGNGYTTGGAALTGVTWTEVNPAIFFNSNDASFAASGGSLVFRYAVIYDNTTPNKDLVCFSLLDTTPANITVPDGTTFTLGINAQNIGSLT